MGIITAYYVSDQSMHYFTCKLRHGTVLMSCQPIPLKVFLTYHEDEHTH